MTANLRRYEQQCQPGWAPLPICSSVFCTCCLPGLQLFNSVAGSRFSVLIEAVKELHIRINRLETPNEKHWLFYQMKD